MLLRTLKLRLRQILENDPAYSQLSQEEIADRLGVVPNTVRKYLRNETLKLERRVLERACDWLNLGIGDLLELVPCDFFPPGGNLLRLRSKPDDPADYFALGTVQQLFDNVRIDENFSEDREQLARDIYQRNCLIVGSPHHNAAGEIALSTLFGIQPYDTSELSRRKLPLTIEVPPDWQSSSALVQKATHVGRPPLQCRVMAPDTGEKSGEMTFLGKQVVASAEYYPPKQFQPTALKGAKDFGIILIADHWISTQEAPVRTYWLSGFSSVGTLASLRAVQDNVRDFSLDTPRSKPGEFVLAVVQATFRKEAGAQSRILNDNYEIVHRIRGSLPQQVVPLAKSSNEKPPGKQSEGGPPAEESHHDKRRENFRMLVRKTWSGDLTKGMPTVMNFYDEELRDVPEESFADLIKNLERKFAGLSRLRRHPPLDQYLQEVKKALDKDPDRLF